LYQSIGGEVILKKGIYVKLKGGLGNQLFEYYAGLYVSKRTTQPFYLESTGIQFGRSPHLPAAHTLNLDAIMIHSKYRFSILSVRHLLRTMYRSRDSVDSLESKQSIFNKFVRTYHSPLNGFDPNLEKIKHPTRLEGYFQSWKYYSQLKEMGELSPKILEVIAPSRSFLQTLSEIKANRILVIHVRRGDYLAVKDSFGLLSIDYYVDAFSTLRQRGLTWDQVWLFTDDSIAVKSEFGELIRDEKIKLIDFDSESNSAEQMILMSHANICVIANSTFSWWAACLSETTQAVVCPSKWFKNFEDPIDLYPMDWITVTSTWVSEGPGKFK
jgi:hypothetical protein